MIVSWWVGDRDGNTAFQFLDDLRTRLANRVQLTTDGFSGYVDAVGGSFGSDAIDYGMLVKLYGQPVDGPRVSAERRYSPPSALAAASQPYSVSPDKAKVSTSYVERQNSPCGCQCGGLRG